MEQNKNNSSELIQAGTEVVKEPLSKLLNPAASVLGDYLGERVEEFVKRKREQRIENIKSHIEAVAKKGEFDPEKILDYPEEFNKWAESAQNISGEEKEESAVHRALLEAINRKENQRKKIIQTLKTLDSEDIELLIKTINTKKRKQKTFIYKFSKHTIGRIHKMDCIYAKNQEKYEKLVKCGILTKPSMKNSSFFILLTIFSFVFVALFVLFELNYEYIYVNYYNKMDYDIFSSLVGNSEIFGGIKGHYESYKFKMRSWLSFVCLIWFYFVLLNALFTIRTLFLTDYGKYISIRIEKYLNP